MHLGIHLVQPRSTRAPAVLQATAHAAEALGYRSVWVGDRLIEADPARRAEGRPLDALATLAFLAATTERVRLGTSVLVGDWYPAPLLARSLATVDQLSRGRLTIGLGAGSDGPERAAGLGEAPDLHLAGLLAALEAAWSPPGAGTDQPGPLPVQQPRPPILLAGSSAEALDRVGRLGDGWHALAAAPDLVSAGWDRVRTAAMAAGRDPDALALTVRVRIEHAADAGAVAAEVAELVAVGAHEVILEAGPELGLDDALARYAAVAEAVELQALA